MSISEIGSMYIKWCVENGKSPLHIQRDPLNKNKIYDKTKDCIDYGRDLLIEYESSKCGGMTDSNKESIYKAVDNYLNSKK